MASTAGHYRNSKFKDAMRRTSRLFWILLAALFIVWCALILLPPIAQSLGMTAVSESLYGFFSHICHQRPDRSFFVDGHKFGVCSRCFGVYFGLLAGALIYPVFRKIEEVEPISRIWLILSMFPIGIDWSLTFFGFWENTYLTRFSSGLILGIACTVFIIPALSELAEIIHLKKQSRVSHV